MLRKPDEDPQISFDERAAMLSQQVADQARPSSDSLLVFHKQSKTGTWKYRSGRITTFCKSRIEIEEILYLMERASITCIDESENVLTVKDMYAELVDSEVNGEEIKIVNVRALDEYIAYGHLRRSGYKVGRSVESGSWNVSDSKNNRFGVTVRGAKDLIDIDTDREEVAGVVDLSSVVFLKVSVSHTVPTPS